MRMLVLVTALWAVLSSPPIFGQSIKVEGDRVYASWDPDDETQLFLLLGDHQVQFELKFSLEMASVYSEIRERHYREYHAAGRIEREGLRKKHRLEVMSSLDELLTPRQRVRLRQLAFRTEVATIGLGKALTRGFLSVAVEVNAEQIPGIEMVAAKAERELQSETFVIRANAETELLEALTAEQRDACKKATGEPWFYQTISEAQVDFQAALDREEASKKSGKPVVRPSVTRREIDGPNVPLDSDLLFAAGDPEFAPQVFAALKDSQIKRELQLTDDQQSSLRTLESNRLARKSMEFYDSLSGKIEAILTPSQIVRLKQLMYRMEIEIAGIGHALTYGRLFSVAGVHVGQREQILRKADEIESEAVVAIANAQYRAERRVFQELSQDQNKRAEEALGDAWFYDTVSVAQRVFDEVKLERIPASEADG